MGIETGWPLLLFMGLALTWMGWAIVFTNWGLEWMYKNDIWKRWHKDNPIWKTQKSFDRHNKYLGGIGFLAWGLSLLSAFIWILLDFYL